MLWLSCLGSLEEAANPSERRRFLPVPRGRGSSVWLFLLYVGNLHKTPTLGCCSAQHMFIGAVRLAGNKYPQLASSDELDMPGPWETSLS